jgi:glutamine synthetase
LLVHSLHRGGYAPTWRRVDGAAALEAIAGGNPNRASVNRDDVRRSREELTGDLAGVLAQLPGMTAIGAPLALSYHRLQPSHWAGVFSCWGNENREAALRLEAAEGPGAARSANVEWKSVDGAANPYLALGAIVAAGLDGLEHGLELPPPVVADPVDLSPDERAAGSIVRLPETIADAAESLAEATVLREAMGPYLHDCVVAVRRAEAEASDGLDERTLVERYRWRF